MVPTSEEYGCTPDEYGLSTPGSTSKNLHLQRIPYIYIQKVCVSIFP